MRCELCSDLEAPAARADFSGEQLMLCEKCANEIGAVFPLRSKMLLAGEYIEDMQRDVVRVVCYQCRNWIEIKPKEMYVMIGYPLCDKCKKSKSPDPSPKVVKK